MYFAALMLDIIQLHNVLVGMWYADIRLLYPWSTLIFTALHGMQTRSSDEIILSVRPSVRLSMSNAWFVTKRKNDVSRFLYHTNDH